MKTEEIRKLTYRQYRELIGGNPSSEAAKELIAKIEAEIQSSPDLQAMLSDFRKARSKNDNVLLCLNDDTVWYLNRIQSDPTVLTLSLGYGYREAFPWEVTKVY